MSPLPASQLNWPAKRSVAQVAAKHTRHTVVPAATKRPLERKGDENKGGQSPFGQWSGPKLASGGHEVTMRLDGYLLVFVFPPVADQLLLMLHCAKKPQS